MPREAHVMNTKVLMSFVKVPLQEHSKVHQLPPPQCRAAPRLTTGRVRLAYLWYRQGTFCHSVVSLLVPAQLLQGLGFPVESSEIVPVQLQNNPTVLQDFLVQALVPVKGKGKEGLRTPGD